MANQIIDRDLLHVRKASKPSKPRGDFDETADLLNRAKQAARNDREAREDAARRRRNALAIDAAAIAYAAARPQG